MAKDRQGEKVLFSGWCGGRGLPMVRAGATWALLAAMPLLACSSNCVPG